MKRVNLRVRSGSHRRGSYDCSRPIARLTGRDGKGKTKPAEGPQLPGDDGETNGSDLAQPVLPPQPMSRKQRRLARRRRRQLKKLERQLLGRRSRLRPRLFRKAVPFSNGQLEAVVEAAVARALERERELVEQAEETIDERLKEMSENLERQQREAEKRIITRTERSLEQMAERQQAAQPRGGSTSVRAAKRNALQSQPRGGAIG